MSKPRQTLDQAPIHTFLRFNADGTGAGAVARFYPYDAYPIVFTADTPEKAAIVANEWRTAEMAHAQLVKENRAKGMQRRKAAS